MEPVLATVKAVAEDTVVLWAPVLVIPTTAAMAPEEFTWNWEEEPTEKSEVGEALAIPTFPSARTNKPLVEPLLEVTFKAYWEEEEDWTSTKTPLAEAFVASAFRRLPVPAPAMFKTSPEAEV